MQAPNNEPWGEESNLINTYSKWKKSLPKGMGEADLSTWATCAAIWFEEGRKSRDYTLLGAEGIDRLNGLTQQMFVGNFDPDKSRTSLFSQPNNVVRGDVNFRAALGVPLK